MLSKTYKTREIESALMKKGFQEYKTKHHKYYIWQNDQKKTVIQTFISHGKHEYNGSVLSSLRKQLHLKNNQFDAFVQCSLTKKDLEMIYSEMFQI